MGQVIGFPPRAVNGAPAAEREQAPLWREAAGRELRQERAAQKRTLADVAEKAGVSTQYLSEVERGRKEPSSEVVEAVGGALGLTLLDLTTRVSERLRAQATRPRGPVALAA
ncbi:MAG TPA: helix-turn-helix transcriptional regulator [Marmoricola sp.]